MTFTTLRTKMQIRATPMGGAGIEPRFVTYLDHNATTPLASTVYENLGEWAQAWGNPSSIHQAGRAPKTLMRESRDRIAKMVNVSPLEVIFTSGGSEANSFALKGVFEALRAKSSPRKHYLMSEVEHPSLRKAADFLVGQGAEVEFIPVGRNGAIDMDFYRKHLREDTALVSVMIANNETGNLFPIEEMTKLAHAHGALFHTDGVQALGKMPVDLRALGVDLASFAGHKFYALKGAGFLYCKRGTPLEPLILGGGQERHRRGGTENLLAVASLGKMCEYRDQVVSQGARLAVLRDRLESELLNDISGLTLTGAESPRLPNSSSMVIEGVDGETLLMNLDMRGFAVSTGAACSSGSPEPSPVLLSMGLTRKEAQSSLRLGLGWETTEQEITEFVQTLKDVVSHLRSLAQAAVADSESSQDESSHSSGLGVGSASVATSSASFSTESSASSKILFHDGVSPEKARIHGHS